GRGTSSMAALLASVATPEDKATWIAEADRLTVREMTARIAQRSSAQQAASGVSGLESFEAAEPFRTLTITVPREDAWLFEGARLLAKHVGEPTLAGACGALVAEGMTTLLEHVPSGAIALDDDRDESRREAQQSWEAELRRMR